MEGLDRTRDVSLYIHIPFCRTKCDYCAFYSRSPREGEMERYAGMLIREIREVAEGVGKPFATVYIGGGNPGVMGWKRIAAIVEETQRKGRSGEVTLECNPEDLDETILSLHPLVSRLSIGIQSLSESVLRTLGRRSTREANLRALSLLSSSPFSWNADIITAVPGESVETTLSDIGTVASFGPGHISFYCLTFEEGTPLTARLAPLSEEDEALFLERGWEELEKLGYNHYEVSNFAKKGMESKHNSVYWSLGQYIGLGPTAESALGWSEMVVMRNTESLEEYLSSPSFNCERLGRDETEESYLLTALRTAGGIDKTLYRERFGFSFDDRYSDSIALLDGMWYDDTPSSFRVTGKGMMVLDRIILAMALSV